MIIRMLRAGAGTWPVARPKRADKIMRRIRRILRMFGENVERLVSFVKTNFAAGRAFVDITQLNAEALQWCAEQGGRYRRAPTQIGRASCRERV